MPDNESNDRDLVFYYSRARRLERASPAVQALNEPGPKIRAGFFRPLTATKSHSILFLTIILLFAVIFIVSFLRPRDAAVLGGNALAVSALGYRDSTILVIKKRIQREDAVYAGAVDMAVSPVLSPEDKEPGAEVPISAQRIFFTLEPREEFRLSVPFEGPELLILLRAGEERITLRVKPE
ncbi:MAG: hypothetical protein LBP32_09165 [Spirochaetaceae bacterium]|jgi:hypothetical protein|nr:hypothetical protein [Spirochaetaceae bacterium]